MNLEQARGLDKKAFHKFAGKLKPETRNFIDGKFVDAKKGRKFETINPATGEVIAGVARSDASDVDAAVKAARKAFKSGVWSKMAPRDRMTVIYKFAKLIEENALQFALLDTTDMGKPISEMLNIDIPGAVMTFNYFGETVDKIEGQVTATASSEFHYILRQPLGVVGCIVPWNYPLMMASWKVAPALAVGNSVILKPAEEACLTAIAFAAICEEAGLPAGALNVVPGLGEEAGAALTAHPGVNHISFTGSVGVGTLVQQAAAKNVVPVTLELGGKSPQVVFADADLDRALPFLVNAGIQNAGQTCSASSRILVQRKLHDEVLARMAERYRALQVGPALADLDVGPMVSERQKQVVAGFLADLGGANIAAQGQIVASAPEGGHYIAPTLLGSVDPQNRLARDEIFGPVQVVIPFEDEAEAVAIANGTDYGLVAGIWTADGGRQMRLAKAIRSGQVFINNYGAGGGVELPFGGTGKSGHGREKGLEALYGFSVLKTVAAWHG